MCNVVNWSHSHYIIWSLVTYKNVPLVLYVCDHLIAKRANVISWSLTPKCYLLMTCRQYVKWFIDSFILTMVHVITLCVSMVVSNRTHCHVMRSVDHRHKALSSHYVCVMWSIDHTPITSFAQFSHTKCALSALCLWSIDRKTCQRD